MLQYISKRLILLPITLFCIILVNFIIINLAPGEPVYMTQIGAQGEAARSESQAMSMGPGDRYLQFREFFGLTLPLIFNTWPWTSQEELVHDLEVLHAKREPGAEDEMSAQKYSKLRVKVGDEAQFCLPKLLAIANNPSHDFTIRKIAVLFFFRGGTRFGYIGPNLCESQKKENEIISKNNLYLEEIRRRGIESPKDLEDAIRKINIWYQENRLVYNCEPTFWSKIRIAFFDTRFSRYMSKVLTLNFGVLRNDTNRTVISEVASRLKISLTLAVIPMLITFVLCQLFGLYMAIKQGKPIDLLLNSIFLIAWATPVFVIGPFLIEKVALNHLYPFTDLPFPIRGFSSNDAIYYKLTTWGRVEDIARHITLPIITILYGSLAMQSRLSKAVFSDTLNQEYVRTAVAKGATSEAIYFHHVARNAAIPIITAVSGSLGLIIGGSVIIETIFEIHGFGKFFYDAIINRDYNVMMFSTLVGSFLALVGYLIADLAYMFLDPRVRLEAKAGA